MTVADAWFGLPSWIDVQLVWIGLLGFAACLWVLAAIRMARGIPTLPRLAEVPPLADARCPSVSILVAARDEAAGLPRALSTLLAQDYPSYEVVVVDDRSRDETPRILDDFARAHPRLTVIHLSELPDGWLGKPHALTVAYGRARGDWLVFTDADVRFAPDLLRRSLAVVHDRSWDHLTLLGLLDMQGFWEKTALTYFVLGFTIGTEPWQASNPRSRRYVGAGTFQLVRRAAYEAIGTHRRLAMEVVDDMKLGKLVKEGGFRSGVALAEDRLQVRWQDGFRNILRGTTKNFFAVAGFSVIRVAGQLAGYATLSLLPYVAVWIGSDTSRLLAAISVATSVLLHGAGARHAGVSPLYGLTHPLGAAVFSYISLRSTIVTLWRGGIVWRDTFYPLSALRRGLV